MAGKYTSGVILDHISYQMLERVGFFFKISVKWCNLSDCSTCSHTCLFPPGHNIQSTDGYCNISREHQKPSQHYCHKMDIEVFHKKTILIFDCNPVLDFMKRLLGDFRSINIKAIVDILGNILNCFLTQLNKKTDTTVISFSAGYSDFNLFCHQCCQEASLKSLKSLK